MPKIDKYAKKYIKMIEKAGKDTKFLTEVINKIYQDGYEDGANSIPLN